MVKLARTICMATCLAGLATSAQATLTAREESIVPIAAFAANGNEAALRGALKSGLEKGLSINEIRSILEQTIFDQRCTGRNTNRAAIVSVELHR